MVSDEIEPLKNTLTYLVTVCLYVACEGLWGDPGCWLCLFSSHALHLIREGAPLQQALRMTARLGGTTKKRLVALGQRASSNSKEASSAPCDPES